MSSADFGTTLTDREHALAPRALNERSVLLAVERAAREYARFTHGNLRGDRYRAREEARDRLLDALAVLDAARGSL